MKKVYVIEKSDFRGTGSETGDLHDVCLLCTDSAYPTAFPTKESAVKRLKVEMAAAKDLYPDAVVISGNIPNLEEETSFTVERRDDKIFLWYRIVELELTEE